MNPLKIKFARRCCLFLHEQVLVTGGHTTAQSFVVLFAVSTAKRANEK